MSVDAAEVQSPPTPPATDLAGLTDIVQSTAAKVASGVATQVITAVTNGLAQADKDAAAAHEDLVGRVEDLEAAAVPAIGAIGASLVTRAETDPILQRRLALLIAGAFLLAGLSILIAYLLGSRQAAEIKDWAWAFLAGPVLAFLYRTFGAPGVPKSVPAVPVAAPIQGKD